MKWEPLCRGDIVDLVAPASACKMSEIHDSIKIIEGWGLVARYPKNMFSGHKIFSNTDQFRWAHLKKAIEAKDSKAVWCVRGGYGSLRVIPELKKIRPPKNPKIFIGYSDITTLHSYFEKKWNWPTLHGPLFDRLGTGLLARPQINRLQKILFGNIDEVKFTKLFPINSKAKRVKIIKAPIVGGNLCTWVSHIGTSLNISSKNRILFFEDIGEKPHRVDRFFTQLTQAGGFRGCKAVILGDFLIDSQLKNLLWKDVIQRFADSSGVPVFKGLPVGHGNVQRTLPLGTPACLKRTAGKQFDLSVATGVR